MEAAVETGSTWDEHAFRALLSRWLAGPPRRRKEKLADTVRCSVRTIDHLCQPGANPGFGLACRLAREFGVTTEEFSTLRPK